MNLSVGRLFPSAHVTHLGNLTTGRHNRTAGLTFSAVPFTCSSVQLFTPLCQVLNAAPAQHRFRRYTSADFAVQNARLVFAAQKADDASHVAASNQPMGISARSGPSCPIAVRSEVDRGPRYLAAVLNYFAS